MPPRPAGTDGSDHSYREVIVERYKRMADFTNAIHKLIALHATFVVLKLVWHGAVFMATGLPVPQSVLSMVALEGLVFGVLHAAKLGASKESLTLLKCFNVVQALLTANVVLSAWQYHHGTRTEGVPTYAYSHAMDKALQDAVPRLASFNLLDLLKALELFLDLCLGAFVIMSTFVSHKMIVEKMQMKKEKGAAAGARKGAVRGGGDDDSDEDEDGDAPQAVPLAGGSKQQQEQQERPKVAKVAASSSVRRRHA